ncbi:hypothetical protein HNP84_000260 [Thermocatellispora tengchongensis]|uniref:Uncharacterized protein n=1 Tax=Thermocatellispora tengchongensis TaxID=1073253 RepID=A0A840NTJ0_9ACTN|nr:hypothetical protein [Thermocatellispora tengchongensis]
MTTPNPNRALPRAVRQAMPLARDVVEEVAKQHGVCIRPVPLQRTDTHTGQIEIIDVPCGATLDNICPPCAKRNRQLRMAQCREGWHLDEEPAITPDDPTDEQRWLVEFRADVQAQRDRAAKAGHDTTDLDAAIAGIDAEINAAGMRGNVLSRTAGKRTRSTKRRQDAPDLPRRKMTHTTLGRTFVGSDGKTYRPSLFVTLTLPSYGRVRDGVPIDPDTYATPVPLAMRCTSPNWSTGSCRTSVASPTMTCSTSPPSNRKSGSPRTCTWPSAAPSPDARSSRSRRQPTTKCGGLPSIARSSTASTCPSGMTASATSTRQPVRS